MGYITVKWYSVESKKTDFLTVVDSDIAYNFKEFSYDGNTYYTTPSINNAEFQVVKDIDIEILIFDKELYDQAQQVIDKEYQIYLDNFDDTPYAEEELLKDFEPRKRSDKALADLSDEGYKNYSENARKWYLENLVFDKCPCPEKKPINNDGLLSDEQRDKLVKVCELYIDEDVSQYKQTK